MTKIKPTRQCVILNVNTTIICQGYPISQVILTAAKLDREHNRNGKTKTLKAALKGIQKDFRILKKEYFATKDEVTNQEYVDFVNKFLRLRAMEYETSAERFERRMKV